MIILPLDRQSYIDFEGDPPPVTMKGLALKDGNNTLAILSLAVFDGENFIICGVKDGASKKNLIRGWLEFKKKFMKDDKDYYALCDETIKTSKGFLKHFGFVHLEKDIYVYRG